MQRTMCKSKIHRAIVTEANLLYHGSITIDRRLMEEADIYPFERVQVANLNNGERFETYVIEGPEDSGVICLNGAAARCVEPGDPILIMSYAVLDDKEARMIQPKVVHVDERNRITKVEIMRSQNVISASPHSRG